MGKVLLAYKSKSVDTDCHEKSHAGLGISAYNAAKVLQLHDIDAIPLAVFDGYELEKALRNINDVSSVVIYAPWIDMGFIEALCKRWPCVQFTVTIHSNIAFLQSDPFAIKIIRQGTEVSRRINNFVISANCERLARFVHKTYLARCPNLPNLYFIPPKGDLGYRVANRPLRIGLFGAIRQLKNLLTGVAAGILLSCIYNPVNLFINGGRVEGGEGILKAINELVLEHKNFQLTTIDWLEWDQFTKLIGTMDILFQPSFSESFNNVTADGCAQYIPSVVSPAITWVPDYWKAQPDDVFDIANTAIKLLNKHHAGIDGNWSLRHHNRKGVDKWLEYLGTGIM
jgi:hypothetical protein